jgi:hypothetical protein|eukprot:COSAG01_NODE_5909_length_3955_cov_4.622280_6_plen_43_part_00
MPRHRVLGLGLNRTRLIGLLGPCQQSCLRRVLDEVRRPLRPF